MKKVVSRLLFILLFIGTIVISSLGVTYAYFTKNEKNALVYTGGLYNLYNKYNMKLEKAFEKTAELSFTFKPTDALYEGETDEYEIILPTTCNFKNITSTASPTAFKQNVKTHTLKYTNSTDRNFVNKIDISCEVTANTDINVEVKINLKISTESTKIRYIHYQYSKKYSDYVTLVAPKVDESKDNVEENNLYSEFKTWITAIAGSTNFEKEINKYVNDKCTDESCLKNNELLGLNVEKNKETQKYKFELLDNFIGYARMYYQSTVFKNINEGIKLYFSSESSIEMDKALKDYLKMYVYPNNEKAVTTVYDYIKNNGGIKSVIDNGTMNDGATQILKLESYNNDTHDSNLQLYRGRVLSIASAKEGSDLLVLQLNSGDLSNDTRTMKANFSLGFKKLYSADLNTIVRSRTDIMDSVTRISGIGDTTKITDYFIEKNGNDYLLFKVTTDPVNNPLVNSINLTSLTVGENDIITFVNDTNQVTINIESTTEQEVKDAISKLDSYFGKTTTDVNIVKNTETSKYSVQYVITK